MSITTSHRLRAAVCRSGSCCLEPPRCRVNVHANLTLRAPHHEQDYPRHRKPHGSSLRNGCYGVRRSAATNTSSMEWMLRHEPVADAGTGHDGAWDDGVGEDGTATWQINDGAGSSTLQFND